MSAAHSYHPVWVHDLPASFTFQPDGTLRARVDYLIAVAVCRVIAGPERVHVCVDVKRPYFLPLPAPALEGRA